MLQPASRQCRASFVSSSVRHQQFQFHHFFKAIPTQRAPFIHRPTTDSCNRCACVLVLQPTRRSNRWFCKTKTNHSHQQRAVSTCERTSIAYCCCCVLGEKLLLEKIYALPTRRESTSVRNDIAAAERFDTTVALFGSILCQVK